MPEQILDAYGRWWQVETWLRTVMYINLKSEFGTSWHGHLAPQAARYARNDSAHEYMSTPDRSDLMSYLDTGKLFELIEGKFEKYRLDEILISRASWSGRVPELQKIRRSIAHCRRPHRDDVNRLEQLLRDLEPGFWHFFDAQSAEASKILMGDPVIEQWRGSKISHLREHVERKYTLDITLGFASQVWADRESVSDRISGKPGFLWALDLGGPDYFVDLERFWSGMDSVVREAVVNVFSPSPFGLCVTLSAVDRPELVGRAIENVISCYGRASRAIQSVSRSWVDAWPGDRDLVDPRVMVDQALALLSHDDRGTTIFCAG
ncbi:hypothetical protein ACOKM5_26450 [Streptomyces sp. BH097]|uniref:hypothetical protein n=1 Tax=unclassified Streptomyces TaxID=2593676 RepID=UPI003BB71016